MTAPDPGVLDVDGPVLDPPGHDRLVPVRLIEKRNVAERVCELTFRSTTSEPLPPPSAGAHVSILTPSGDRRSYSLTRGPDDRDQDYVIAVALEPDSRGGSLSMHTSTEVGMTMWISPAVNSFPLHPAPDYLLIAGGIGITPMRSMFHVIRARGDARVRLVYLARSRHSAPYLAELTSDLDHGSQVLFHATDEHDGNRFDLWSVLGSPSAGRVYCCASPAVLETVRLLTMHWRSSRVHFETFGGVDQVGEHAAPFTAHWEPTGQEIEVRADTTLFDALKTAGISVPVSCRAGTCGTCRVGLVSGDVDHRDVILSEEQRKTQLTACVSRGRSHIVVGPAESPAGAK